MATATPKKLVHWALNASLSDLGSPFSDISSSDSCTSTSSLEYINSQLVAHGFVHDAGISLEGLAKGDADRVVKCILGMLGQRIEDMSRTENLSTKLRTLSYDHERLTSMYKSESEKAANAERDMNLHKSRMTAATKSLQSCENAHKHTTSELQRTRSALHSLRATQQTELKKLEKEKERMVERWSKLSDAQLKIGSLHAGLSCSNLDVVEASDVQIRGKGQGFLDVALEQAEDARKELFEQNRKLRGLLLSAANQLQMVLHAARTAGESEYREEPSLLTGSSLFSDSPAAAAGETFNSLFSSIHETIAQKFDALNTSSCPRKVTLSVAEKTEARDSAELERLQSVINKLRGELDQAQKQAATSAAQTQELFDHLAEEQRHAARDPTEMSVELMTAPARDEEKRRLDERFRELEEERRKFTEAAVRLGKEKAALEADRLKLLEEKRSWEVEMMLAELPPTPASAAGPSFSQHAAIPASMLPKPSPRKSARKVKAKTASARKTRVSRRSSGLGAIISPRRQSKVLPAYETEVIPSIPPSPSRPLPEFKTSIAAPSPPPRAMFSSAFILPPPSPAASLPSGDGIQTPLPPIPPLPKFEIPPPSSADSSEDDIMNMIPESTPLPASSSSSSSASSSSVLPPVPRTPVCRPFPMAKPGFAQRMVHAYSPVKPSPLSRILMMADSPESPPNRALSLAALAEVDENAMTLDEFPVPMQEPVRTLSLAEELGVSEDDDSPFKEKLPPTKSKPAPAARKATDKEKDVGKAKEKAKARPDKPVPAQTQQTTTRARTRAGATLEKENVKRAKLSNPTPSTVSSSSSGANGSAKSSASSRVTRRAAAGSGPEKPTGIGARARATAAASGRGAKPTLRGGPRRVPAGSAEAASVPTWKG